MVDPNASSIPSAAPDASTSDTPLAPLGKRAEITQDALMRASSKVTKTLTDKAMLECFPELDQAYQRAYDNDPALAKQHLTATLTNLKQQFVKDFDERIPVLWAQTCKKYEFIERANQLDKVVEEAKQAKARGDEPRNMFFYGADGSISIPSATVPVLRQATEDLKAKRIAHQATVDRTETQLREMAQDFVKAMETLKAIDSRELTSLQDQLLQSLKAEEIP
ncbi:hypothetical protein OIV83_004982 [Microbotryomycetes sp. JL201]|nr:hypothetical protein OIV83_004982 [Microbotryomycetes sp. JL201]